MASTLSNVFFLAIFTCVHLKHSIPAQYVKRETSTVYSRVSVYTRVFLLTCASVFLASLHARLLFQHLTSPQELP